MCAVAVTPRTVTMHGKPLELAGHDVKVGNRAPDFVAVDNDLNESGLSQLTGRVLVLSSVPSLDTSVCSLETRRFDLESRNLASRDVQFMTISMDLPFAQKRWKMAEGVEHVTLLSDYRYASFGSAYGVLIKDLRLEARCVFIVDAERRVRYIQLVPEVTNEPDYAQVLAEIRRVMG